MQGCCLCVLEGQVGQVMVMEAHISGYTLGMRIGETPTTPGT